MVATPLPIPTATRGRNDARRNEFDSAVADAASRCLPRNQSRHGMAVCGGAGYAGAKGSAVARSLVPIALGHALAICSVVMIAAFLGAALPLLTIRYSVAALLVGLGIFSLLRHWHPRWVRMRVGFRDLTAWSFLMASAHGAGLMVLPVLLSSSTVEAHRIWPATVTCLRSPPH